MCVYSMRVQYMWYVDRVRTCVGCGLRAHTRHPPSTHLTGYVRTTELGPVDRVARYLSYRVRLLTVIHLCGSVGRIAVAASRICAAASVALSSIRHRMCFWIAWGKARGYVCLSLRFPCRCTGLVAWARTYGSAHSSTAHRVCVARYEALDVGAERANRGRGQDDGYIAM